MLERIATVRAPEGLHARPASEFAAVAAGLPVTVTIRTDAVAPQAADSTLGLMLLGAKCGDQVTLRAEGTGAAAALDTLAELLENPH